MRRIIGYTVAATATASTAYAYYKHVYRKEPSPLLGRLMSKYMTSPSLKMHIGSASLQYDRHSGFIVQLFRSRVCRDDDHRDACSSDNYARFDLSIDSIRAELDMARWLFDQRSPVVRCEVEGVRGCVDRTHLVIAPSWKMSYRKEEPSLDRGFSLKDVLVSVRNAQDSPTFPVSIYAAVLPRLRWSWFLCDVLNASSIIGSYDNSLFTYQPPQFADPPQQAVSSCLRHLRVDSLPVEHVNRGVQHGPLSWIQKGRMAIDVLVRLPVNAANIKTVSDGDSNIRRFLKSLKIDDDSLSGFITAIRDNSGSGTACYSPNTVDMRVDLRLTGIKAKVPLLTSDISLMNQALVRPVVAYLNEHRHHTLPLSFSFSLSMPDDLRGAWGIHESGIADRLAVGVAGAFTELATDKHRASERVRRVGLWSLYSMLKQLTFPT